MYTRREVYISDPAPYRQTLTCTAKDVFANDQAPAPDNNATVRNQDTPSLFVLLPSCSEQGEIPGGASVPHPNHIGPGPLLSPGPP